MSTFFRNDPDGLPDGLRFRAGEFRGKPVWYSDDGGETWWCGTSFAPSTKVTHDELIKMAVSILQDAHNTQKQQ